MSVELTNRVEYAELERKSIALPESIDKTLLAFPELKPLLIALAHQDSATFMHSVAVHTVVSRLVRDLCLRYQLPVATQQYLEDLLPFLLLHDIGKGGTHKSPSIAKLRVHPESDLLRPTEDIAFHWLHSEIGYDMLQIWAEQFSGKKQLQVLRWAELTRQHQPEIYTFLAREKYAQHLMPQPVSLPPQARLVLNCFRIGDTCAAAALPRPNRTETYDYNYLVAHIRRLCEKMHLDRVFGEQNPDELTFFITTSVIQSLQQLQKEYQTVDWLDPKGFTNPEFTLTVAPTLENIRPLLYLTYQAWHRAERRWDAIIRLMEDDGIFSFSKQVLATQRKKLRRNGKD